MGDNDFLTSCSLWSLFFFTLPREVFFFKFPYWLKEHFRVLKSISLFTEAIKTSLQLFHVASALNHEHFRTSNYSFEENSLSSKARHFPSHSLKFRQPEHCKCQVFFKVRLYNEAGSKPKSHKLCAGFQKEGWLRYVFQGYVTHLDLQGPQASYRAGRNGFIYFYFHLFWGFQPLLQW
jgi:hypothetical protein